MDFLCYDITTTVDMNLGERVRMDGRLLTVSRKEAELMDGRVLFTYRLAGRGYACVSPLDNGNLTGLELPARVTGTGGEMCELALDIDPGQEGGHEYPYAPMTGNLMYCMPREQTRAYLRLGSSSEGSGMVSRCIRTNGEECESLASPEQRSFHTEHGKGMEFSPGSLGFVGTGTGSLTLCDGEGISLGSTGGITLHAQGKIMVESGGSIHLDALTQIAGQSLRAAFSAFCVNGRFDYLSSQTVLEGKEIRRYRPFDDAPVEGKFDWAGFAGNLVVGTMVAVGCIALVAIPAVGPLLTGALLGAALGAAGETLYMAHKEFSSGNVRGTYEMGRDLTIATVGGFMTGASAVVLPIASLFGRILASAGFNTGVNMLQRAAWAGKDDLEDKAGYIFDPEQIMVDFGNGINIGITVPQLVAMKVYDQPKLQRATEDMNPPDMSGGSGGGSSGPKEVILHT